MFLNRYSGSTRPGSGKVGGSRRRHSGLAVAILPAHAGGGPRRPPGALSPIGPDHQATPIIIRPDQSANPPASALTPAQIRHAYGIDQVTFGGITGDGAGQTIAIVDAGDNPGFLNSTDPNFDNSDLHKFDQQFGLPDPPSFMKVNQEGSQRVIIPPSNVRVDSQPRKKPSTSSGPRRSRLMANIVLVEATTNLNSDLQAATATAANLPGVSVVSMSFGGAEVDGEQAADPTYLTPAGHQGVTFLASTGDDGAPGGYPAFSPNVVAVGGTTLNVDAAGNYISESGWSGSGGGISQFEPQPAYQNGVVTQSTTMRTIPDVAFDADPATGVAVFDSTDFGAATPWEQIGGTSLACPCWAGIIAITDQDRVRVGLGTLDGATQTLPQIYTLPASDFHDITSGNNGFWRRVPRLRPGHLGLRHAHRPDADPRPRGRAELPRVPKRSSTPSATSSTRRCRRTAPSSRAT